MSLPVTFLLRAAGVVREVDWNGDLIELYDTLSHFTNDTGRSWHYPSTWYSNIPWFCRHYKKWYWSCLRQKMRHVQVDNDPMVYPAFVYGTLEVGQRVWIQPLDCHYRFDDIRRGGITKIDRISDKATLHIVLEK